MSVLQTSWVQPQQRNSALVRFDGVVAGDAMIGHESRSVLEDGLALQFITVDCPPDHALVAESTSGDFKSVWDVQSVCNRTGVTYCYMADGRGQAQVGGRSVLVVHSREELIKVMNARETRVDGHGEVHGVTTVDVEFGQGGWYIHIEPTGVLSVDVHRHGEPFERHRQGWERVGVDGP